MSGLTMTDCSVEGNRVQARHELDRALALVEGPSRYTLLHDWAEKWGRELLDYANDAPSEDDVAEEVARAGRGADDAETARDELQTAIDKAIDKLDEIETSDEIRDLIDAAVSILENA